MLRFKNRHTFRALSSACAAVLAASAPNPAGGAPIVGAGSPSDALPGGVEITFDNGPAGSHTTLTLSGVTFSGSGGDGTFVINGDYIGDYNSRGVYSVNNNTGNGITTFRFNFDDGVVSGLAFHFGASDNLWVLTAYDINSVPLESLNLTPTGGSNAGDYFGLQVAGIAYATLVDTNGGGDYILLDDFTFLANAPASATAAPAAAPDRREFTFEVRDGAAMTSAIFSGLNTAVVFNQAHRSASRTALRDLNGHLFALRAGQGQAEMDDTAEERGAQGDTGLPPDSKMVRPTSTASQRWQIFSKVDYGALDLDSIGSQSGVNGDTWAPSIGIERRLGKHFTFGLALSYLESDQEFSNDLGGLKLQGMAVSSYLSFVAGPLWSELLYSYGNYDMETTRRPGFGFRTAHGDAGTHANAIQFNTGWNFKFDVAGGKLATGPFVGVDYLNGRIGAYEETGGGNAALRYGRQNYDSLITRLGWQISESFITPVGRITPQIRVAWERENLESGGVNAELSNSPYYLLRASQVGNDPSTLRAESISRDKSRKFKASLDQQSPAENYLTAGAGVQIDFGRGFSAQFDYEGMFFRTNLTEHLVSARLSYSF